jgi:hypothetical protein
MTHIHVLVEGQTEEAFVNRVLAPYYKDRGLSFRPILVQTSRRHSGGLVSYAKVKPQIELLCTNNPLDYVTTLFDLYALPGDFPRKNHRDYPAQESGQRKAGFLERAWTDDANQPKFIANLVIHEFEALLFSDVAAFELFVDDAAALKPLYKIKKAPEDINDGRTTAPSKRILQVMKYQKTSHGPQIAQRIGLDTIRAKCPHFDAWLRKIEGLASR